MNNIREWISENPVGAIALCLASLMSFVVVPAMWFNHHGGGEYFGTVVGFLALLTGALFNAHLERLRDDRLHQRQMVAALLSIITEIGRNSAIFKRISTSLASGDKDAQLKATTRQHLSLLSDGIFQRNIETFMAAANVSSTKIDNRPIDAYLVNLAFVRDSLLSMLEMTEGEHVDRDHIADLIETTEQAHQSAEKAYAESNKILAALRG